LVLADRGVSLGPYATIDRPRAAAGAGVASIIAMNRQNDTVMISRRPIGADFYKSLWGHLTLPFL